MMTISVDATTMDFFFELEMMTRFNLFLKHLPSHFPAAGWLDQTNEED